ncbi:MAG: hypothetical protein ACT4PT_14340 [Methanobacteriota archaeon]
MTETLDVLRIVLGGLASLLAASLAAFVYAAAPRRAPNRRLALALGVESSLQAGSALIGLGAGLGRPFVEQGGWGVVHVSLLLLPAVYLLFLSTLDTPLARPFRSRAVLGAVGLASFAGAALRLADYGFFVERGSGGYEPRLPLVLWMAALLGVFLYGLACAFSARSRTASGTLARRRATAYLLAFGVRDVSFLAAIVPLNLLLLFDLPLDRPAPVAAEVAPLVGTILFVPLVAYGILRAQLFDIDVKIRWTVRQGTLAAAFLAVFFVVEQLVAASLSDRIGTVLGILAAGALVFALAPLQRAAARVAELAVPQGAPETLRPEERTGLYRELAAQAWQDGVVDRSERLLLERARARLGVPAEEAFRIEREVAEG